MRYLGVEAKQLAVSEGAMVCGEVVLQPGQEDLLGSRDEVIQDVPDLIAHRIGVGFTGRLQANHYTHAIQHCFFCNPCCVWDLQSHTLNLCLYHAYLRKWTTIAPGA